MRRRLLQRWHQFVGDNQGVGAIEFAMVAPLLLLLYLGGVDVTRAIMFSHKMQNATVAVNDLVTQATALTKADVLETFDAADAMLASFRVDDLKIRVTAVEIDKLGSAKIAWSVARGLERSTAGKAYTLPAQLKPLRDFTLIVTESSYSFAPLSARVIQASIPMSAEARGRFRGRKAVACSNCNS